VAKIVDLDFAASAKKKQAIDADRILIGTIHYMAPEISQAKK